MITFNPLAFVDNLYYMGVGMLGIFVVMGAVIALVLVLNRATRPRGNK